MKTKIQLTVTSLRSRGLLSQQPRLFSRMILAGALAALLTVAGSTPIEAAGLTASDGQSNDWFGFAVSQSGNSGLAGAFLDNSRLGSAYLFRNLDTATGAITQNVKLVASDSTADDIFGYSVSLSDNIGVVGAPQDGTNSFGSTGTGVAYVFRNLNTATGTITQSAKLTASDAFLGDRFGWSVNLLSNRALVGAQLDNNARGSVYVFRNLDTATGTITQNAKLTAADAADSDVFGVAVSQSGNSGLVGAPSDDLASNANQGSAYLYRNLNTATGTVTQNVKLTAADGAANDSFGQAVSLSGNNGLVGAYLDDLGANNDQGSAYLFRNLDTASGTITHNVKLVASDGAAVDWFGYSVSLSGNTALVGARAVDFGSSNEQGAVYLFRNLDTATGTITQNLKLYASDGASLHRFGVSVVLDGDQFLVGAFGYLNNRGKAYSGSVSSITTLDLGSTSKTISGISFIAQDDWIVGQTTSANQVTLSAGDSATVTLSGKKVVIGQNAGSNNNNLIIAGTLTANTIEVGSVGNTGNVLQIGIGGTSGTLSPSSVITNHGSVVFNRSVATTQGTHFGNAPLTGTGSVTQTGTGTTTFNAANTYSGDTIIHAGTLKLDLGGSFANSANIIVGDVGSSNARLDVTTKTGGLTIGALQTLRGSGQIDGPTLIAGTHAPGNSPGLQTINGDLGYNSGAQFSWELAANVATDTLGVRGTNFDGVNVIGAGLLTVQAGVTSNLIFNAASSTVDWNNAFWDSNHTWLVYDNTNAPSLNSGTIFDSINVSPDSLGATLTGGTFSWAVVGNDVQLNFTAIPEPSLWVWGAVGLLGLSASRRRCFARKK